jgi:trimeric autotransporter adhesin
MSNKTLKQRIAVVAASALTAGFLSVVAMPAANAAAGDLSITAVTGQVVAPATTASTTTLTITTTGTVRFNVAATAASVAAELRISGGTFVSVNAGSANSATINADGSKVTMANVANIGSQANVIAGVEAKPTGAGRDMVITSHVGADTGATSAEARTLAADQTATAWKISATVIAAGTNAVFNSGLSAIAIVSTTGSSLTATSNADASSANIVAAGGAGTVSYALKDANNNDLPSSAIVYGSIKSGACVIGLASTVTSGTFVVGVAPADQLYVRQADQDNTPAQVCVVDITVNGTIAATKTFTFQGPVASIEVTGLGIAESGGARGSLGYVVAKDSAGTLIGNVTVSGITLDSSKSGIVSAVSVANSGATARVAGINGGTAVSSSTVPTTVGWTCGSTVGTAPVAFRTPNGLGGYITSPTYNVACAGNAVTYTASLDKASYLPGDIATLTITGKGSKGELANDAYVFAAASTGEVMSLTGSQLTLVGTTGSETFTNGVKSYKFVVGTTEGSYNLVVDLPKILSATNKATYGAATQTVAYKVAGSGAVSNADVLKSIVALIASINKQIQALQKLILKR